MWFLSYITLETKSEKTHFNVYAKRKHEATGTFLLILCDWCKGTGTFSLSKAYLLTFQEQTDIHWFRNIFSTLSTAPFKFIVLFHTYLLIYMLCSIHQYLSIAKTKGENQQLNNKTFWHVSTYLKTTKIMIVALGNSTFKFRGL